MAERDNPFASVSQTGFVVSQTKPCELHNKVTRWKCSEISKFNICVLFHKFKHICKVSLKYFMKQSSKSKAQSRLSLQTLQLNMGDIRVLQNQCCNYRKSAEFLFTRIIFWCTHFWKPRIDIVVNKVITFSGIINKVKRSWWRHQMETSSALLALCAGNSPSSPYKGQWRGALMYSLICT